MRDLEQRFALAAAADGNPYFPNFTPTGPVDAVLVAMEPSWGGWAHSEVEARQRIADGLRNFMWSSEAAILHWAARRHLCAAGATYHITDISKGAMPVATAHVERRVRYERWAPLLKEEIAVVAKTGAQVIAIGTKVSEFLRRSRIASDFKSVIHYSPLAGAARSAAARELGLAEFSAFAETFDVQDLVDVATEIMQENAVPSAMALQTIDRLARSRITESQKKLAFVYANAFAELRRRD